MLPKEGAVMGVRWCSLLLLLCISNSEGQLRTPDPSEILLSSLDPTELDHILDSTLEDLQIDIFREYQEQLHRHEDTVDSLVRKKRQASVDPVAVLPPYDDNFGHSYKFGTGVGNREVVVVDSLDLVGYLGSLTITDVFPLGLTNITAIYKGDDGFGYIIVDGTLKPLTVRNEYTASTTGCRCDGSSPPVTRSHETCACCVPGACLCRYALGFDGESCVPCGTETTNCPVSGAKQLELDAAVGFEYYTSTGLQHLVITAKSTVISFHSIDEHGLQIVRSETGLSTLVSEHPITHLGYGETFINFYGTLKKRRFLLTFSAGQVVQQMHTLLVGPTDTAKAVGLSTVWEGKGDSMKVFQSGARVIITVKDERGIIVYELKEDKWKEFLIQKRQRIKANVITWTSFNLGFENYLVIVETRKIIIYRLESYYVKKVTIFEAGQLLFDNLLAINVRSCRNEVVLVVGSGSRAVIYTLVTIEGSLQARKEKIYNLDVDNVQWKYAFGYSEGEGAKLIIPGSTVPVAYFLSVHLQQVDNQVWKENVVVEETIRNFKREYERQTSIIDRIEDRLQNSIDVNTVVSGNITITAFLSISQTLVTTYLIADKLMLPGTDMAGGVDLGAYRDYLRRFNETRARIDNILDSLLELRSSVEEAISGIASGGTIGGRVTILNPGLNLQTLIAENINIGNPRDMNGVPIDLEALLRGLVRHGDGRLITGQKRFTGELTIGEFNVKFLDDIPINDIVTTRSEQTIEGAIFHSVFFAIEIIFRDGATVGGKDLSQIISLNDIVRIRHAIFQSIVIEANLQLLSTVVNGFNLQRFDNALLLTGGELRGSLAFNRDIVVSRLDAVRLMGIDTSDFLDNVVFKDKPAFLDGRLTVNGPVEVQNLRIDGNINNRNLFEDLLLRRDTGPIVFRGLKQFSNVKFDKLKFGPHGTINGIDPDTLVTKSTNQFISGSKVFAKGVHIQSNLEIASRIIDGVNLDHIIGGSTGLPVSGTYNFDVTFTSSVTLSSLAYSGLLNGFDFSAFASDLVYDDGPFRVSGSKIFQFGLTVDHAQINGLLNGEDIDNLITTSRNHIIGGTKSFIGSVRFDNLVAQLVDGVDLDDFVNSVLLLNKDGQVVTGRKIFVGTVVLQNLDLRGRLSNVDFTKVVTRTGNQVFTAPQTLNVAVFSELHAQTIILSNGYRVNGIDLSELAARRLTLKSSVDHTGTLIIDGPLHFDGNVMFQNINNVNLQELERNLVKNNEDSTINGPVIVSNLVVNGDISTLNKKGANGLSISLIANKAAKLTGNNKFTGSINFDELELRGDVAVSGLVNGVNLAALRDDAVYLNSNEILRFTGTKTLLSGFHVNGNINTETTNGVDLSTRLVTLHRDQHISETISFDNILAKNGVFLQGNFNGIDLASLKSKVTTAQTRYDSIRFGKNVKVEGLSIAGSLNGINIQARLADAIRLDSSRISVIGKKSFTSNTRFGHLNVGRLNSVDFRNFLDNVILRNSNKVVTRPFTVNGLISAPWVTAENLAVQGTVDGVDYRSIKNNFIYLNRRQNIQTELIFERSIRVRGNIVASFLNGKSLTGDYLTIRTEQSFTIDAHLASIFSRSNVVVGGLVNGIFLPRLEELTMQVIGGQVISGVTVIKGATKVLGNIEVIGRTGIHPKLDLGAEVIDLHSGGEINGLLRFTNTLVTSRFTSTPYLLNGVDFRSLYNNALFIDTPATITARLTFTQEVIFNLGLVISGGFDGLNVRNLYDTVATILAQFGNTTVDIRADYGRMCNAILNLYDQLEDSLYEGECFNYVYTEVFPQLRHSSYSFNAFNETYLIMSYDEHCLSEVYVWSSDTRTFHFYQSLAETGEVHNWLHVKTGDGRIYLAAAASKTDNFCPDKNSTIWEVTRNSIQIVNVVVGGESVSSEVLGGKYLIRVHSVTFTTTYEYNLHRGYWVETSRDEQYDTAVQVLDQKGFSIAFRIRGGVGEIWVEGIIRQTIQLGFSVEDLVLTLHHDSVILLMVVTVYNPHGYTYELRAYEIDYGKLVWLDTVHLRTSGKLSTFGVGNDACNALYIAVTQVDLFPEIYEFFSERLSHWDQLVVPRTTWIQYFPVPNRRFPRLVDHYLILGRDDSSALVYHLQMRGSTVPKIDSSCEIEAFTIPLLKTALMPVSYI